MRDRRRFHASPESVEARQLLTTFLVTSAADAGPGSLREAITMSDAPHAGADNIDFAIPATAANNFDPATQTWRIALAGPLPAITHQVTIDGDTQGVISPISYLYPNSPTGLPTPVAAAPNSFSGRPTDPGSALDGNNAIPRIIVEGGGTAGGTGFVLDASDSILRGLIVDGFDVGVSVPNPGVVGVLIQGDDIGKYRVFPVDPSTGLPVLVNGVQVEQVDGTGNSLQGVLLASTNATVGGVEQQDNNVIIGNGAQGVSILLGAHGNQVIGNQIGIVGPPSANGLYFIVPNGSDGVLIADSSNYVGGAAPGSGNLISGNLGDGVHIVGPAATRNDVLGNYIGTGPGGLFVLGSAASGNQGDGVAIDNASDNDIGGLATADRNVISGNSGAGVRIFDNSGGTTSVRNLVQGNYIGITMDGISALGNGQEGVAITSADNVVDASNVISANLRGVLLAGAGAVGDLVQGNLIGTNAAGTADLGNAQEGVRVENAPADTISGNAAGSQVISGNNVGVLITGAGSTADQVLGNFIGTDITGKLDLGNSQEGVRVEDAAGNSIGAPTATDRNVISANHTGVTITGPTATGNVVQNNLIGTDVTGLSSLGNEIDGVFLSLGASGNLIGGPMAPDGNTVAFNRRDGVRIEDASVRNPILSNAIFANVNLGIDLIGPANLGPAGPVALNLMSPATSIGSTIISGTLTGAPDTVYTIQFFLNTPTVPPGTIEGQQYVGETTTTTRADGTGSYTANLPIVVQAGQVITATATDSLGNTSEFSAPAPPEVFGSVQFSMAGYTVDESAGTATIQVTRAGGSGGLFKIAYATSDGSALAGVEYAATSGTLTFDPGVDAQTFTVPILDDGLPRGDTSLMLSLGNPLGPIMVGAPSTATLTILGNQPGVFRFQMADYFVAEAAGTATITVARDGGGTPATINYSTADGTAVAGADYLPTAGTLSFGPGDRVKTFTVPIPINPLIRGNETVILNLSGPTGGATLGSPSSAVLVIVDDGVDRMGPRVTSARAVAGPRRTADVVVSFDEPLNPATAVDLLNYGYAVRTAGRDGKLGTKDDHLVGIGPATYNPVTYTVTLPLTAQVAIHTRLLLQINEVTSVPGQGVGVSDLLGNLLDGKGNGLPGSPFSAVVVVQPAPVPVPLHKPAPKATGHKAGPARHPAPKAPAHPRGPSAARSGGPAHH